MLIYLPPPKRKTEYLPKKTYMAVSSLSFCAKRAIRKFPSHVLEVLCFEALRHPKWPWGLLLGKLNHVVEPRANLHHGRLFGVRVGSGSGGQFGMAVRTFDLGHKLIAFQFDKFSYSMSARKTPLQCPIILVAAF